MCHQKFISTRKNRWNELTGLNEIFWAMCGGWWLVRARHVCWECELPPPGISSHPARTNLDTQFLSDANENVSYVTLSSRGHRQCLRQLYKSSLDKMMLDWGSDPVCSDQSDSEHRMVTVWSRAELVHANYPGQARPSLLRSLETCGSLHHAPHLTLETWYPLPHSTDITTPHIVLKIALSRKSAAPFLIGLKHK